MKMITAKTIVSGYCENDNWFGNNYNMNIYKGCCHGCIYCDSRSDCYNIDNFDEVRAKENALTIIDRDLKAKRRKGVIGTGSMSDPYNPFEEKFELTRGALRLVDKYGFGISIATKSDLVTRDIDLLKQINEHSPVLIKITVTACDDELCGKIEPAVAPSSKRFEAVKRLTDNGIYAGVLIMPILPFVEDNENNVRGIIYKAFENGAKFIYPAFGVTLRQNQREWFFSKIDKYFPGVKEKYIRTFGNSYECRSTNAESLMSMTEKECERLGVIYKMEDIINAYKESCSENQLSLF